MQWIHRLEVWYIHACTYFTTVPSPIAADVTCDLGAPR